ncbi:uncharacterized protein P884DRAFT_33361 [Thermothelomyces heterothallicus CBS 202.75]|uniref:uncharacterized protein n=1 Tax=Thermothelomyces heterothallicus CBS 202.75 TaxID=1149848 RepID=UPI003743E311
MIRFDGPDKVARRRTVQSTNWTGAQSPLRFFWLCLVSGECDWLAGCERAHRLKLPLLDDKHLAFCRLVVACRSKVDDGRSLGTRFNMRAQGSWSLRGPIHTHWLGGPTAEFVAPRQEPKPVDSRFNFFQKQSRKPGANNFRLPEGGVSVGGIGAENNNRLGQAAAGHGARNRSTHTVRSLITSVGAAPPHMYNTVQKPHLLRITLLLETRACR